jgi:integration host factor subunit beta
LTKTELISKLTEMNPNLGRDDCRIVVATIFGEIAATLCHGDRVEVRGFGTFSVKRQNARAGRNRAPAQASRSAKSRSLVLRPAD